MGHEHNAQRTVVSGDKQIKAEKTEQTASVPVVSSSHQYYCNTITAVHFMRRSGLGDGYEGKKEKGTSQEPNTNDRSLRVMLVSQSSLPSDNQAPSILPSDGRAPGALARHGRMNDMSSDYPIVISKKNRYLVSWFCRTGGMIGTRA